MLNDTPETLPVVTSASALPEGAIPTPSYAKLLPEGGPSGFVFERDGQLFHTYEEPEYPGVYFPENEGCCDDPFACDDEFLVAVDAVLGTTYAVESRERDAAWNASPAGIRYAEQKAIDAQRLATKDL